MRISYAGTLNPQKSLSDQIIYHPVKYKILFGTNADEELQATFKVVKNLKTNDRIIGIAKYGSYCNEIVMPAENVYKIPNNMDFTTGSAHSAEVSDIKVNPGYSSGDQNIFYFDITLGDDLGSKDLVQVSMVVSSQ